MDLREVDLKKILVVSDPEYNVDGGLIYSFKNHDAIGVNYTQKPGRQFYWKSPYDNIQKAIDKSLPDRSNSIVSTSMDEKKYIVFSESSVCPGTYYFVDIENKSLIRIADAYMDNK